MPATKYWLKVTPGAMVSLNTVPKMNSKITGKNKVKTTDSRWRMNCFTSRKLRSTPIRIVSFKVFILIHQSFEDISPQDSGVVPEALESDYQIFGLILKLPPLDSSLTTLG